MLQSAKIIHRQSEIRQELSGLVGKTDPTEDETRSMESLDAEYRTNETRYRAALIAEDEERREAGAELETRSDREWAELLSGFEIRQAASNLDTGEPFSGRTAEIVTELRSHAGYQGIPVPLEALEQRATVSADTPDPIATKPIIDRLFAKSIAMKMGGSLISIPQGAVEWPVATAGATVGWAAAEGDNVPDPTPYQTVDRPLTPDHTLGARMQISRKAMKQSGVALEQAIKRDMSFAIEQEMDRVCFLGTGLNGEPEGLLNIVSDPAIVVRNSVTLSEYESFALEIGQIMELFAASSPADVRILLHPDEWAQLETGFVVTSGSGQAAITNLDRLNARFAGVSVSSNSTTPGRAFLCSIKENVAPFYVGMWGAVDLIRDPYTDAASGALRLTALVTKDVTISRPEQIRILNA